MLKSLLCIFFATLAHTVFGQGNNLHTENAVWSGPKCDTVPIELVNGAIVITISIEGRNARFIFDTGSPLSVSGTFDARHRFDSTGSHIVGDATGHVDSFKNVLIPQLKIGKLLVRNSVAHVLNYQKSSFFQCLKIDGMLGGDLFKSCAVEIDLNKKRLIISTDPTDQASDKETDISFDEQYNPVFNLRLNNSFELKVLFDTGTEELLTVSNETYNMAGRYSMFRDLRKGRQRLTGTHNVSITDEYKVVSLGELKIGSALLRNPEMIVADRNEINILGLEILHYGIIRLDYRHAKMRFIAYSSDIDFTKKMLFPGFSIGRENRIYVVTGMEFGSEADLNGLAIGMQITRIDNISLTNYSRKKDCRILRKNMSALKSITVEYIDFKRTPRRVTLKRNTANN